MDSHRDMQALQSATGITLELRYDRPENIAIAFRCLIGMTPNEARRCWFNVWPQFGIPLPLALTIVL
jgi:hypothetical protein